MGNDLNESNDMTRQKETKAEIEKAGDFLLDTPEMNRMDMDHMSRLEISSADRIRIGALIHELLPAAALAGGPKLCRIQFPEGLPHTLMKLTRQPGFSSTIIGENGKITGTASLLSANGVISAQLAFAALSIVTSQHYLNEINSQMDRMNQKLDQILEFLYGDKKAELLSNQTFVRYAASNFTSIMNSEVQRQATITSLQQARIVAMKDIEFYLNDFDKLSGKNPGSFDDMRKSIHLIAQTYENLVLSEQVFVMSSLMEVYYSQNMEPSYLNYIETETTAYLTRCDRRILMGASTYLGKTQSFKSMNPFEKPLNSNENEPLMRICEKTCEPEHSSLRKSFTKALESVSGKSEFYLDTTGSVYLKQMKKSKHS